MQGFICKIIKTGFSSRHLSLLLGDGRLRLFTSEASARVISSQMLTPTGGKIQTFPNTSSLCSPTSSRSKESRLARLFHTQQVWSHGCCSLSWVAVSFTFCKERSPTAEAEARRKRGFPIAVLQTFPGLLKYKSKLCCVLGFNPQTCSEVSQHKGEAVSAGPGLGSKGS